MGRIKKVAGPKHEATVSKAISDFTAKASSIPILQLPALLRSFPQKWPLPRGDLYHWIPVLNRFDNILEQIIKEYGLDEGPQSKAFGTTLLERGVAGEGKSKDSIQATRQEIESYGFGEDGDRQLAEEVLNFSRTLLENCGNRSLYASSERLGELLNTTSLPLLANALLLLVRLAQRYHASRQRSSNVSQTFNNALLASHYNIDLEKVQKLAEPFVKQASTLDKTDAPSSSKKGKEKNISSRQSSISPSMNDFLELLRGPSPGMNGSAKSPAQSKDPEKDYHKWEDWGNISINYFRNPDAVDDDKSTSSGPRRASTFPKPSRLSNSDGTPNKEGIEAYVAASKAAYTAHIDISSSQVRQNSMEELISGNIMGLPKDVKYDMLCRIRVAYAVTESSATRAQILIIRLLALTNLAYIYSEETFKQKILQRDSDEPRHLQIVQQLCDLLSPPATKDVAVPLELQTTVLGTLEAFAKLKSKASDVCAALSINVNHGVLFQLLRSAVAEMKNETSDDSDARRDDWREAGFALLETLPQCTPRAGESLISAGLLTILVEVLNLRTPQAERSFPKTLTFLNNLVGPIRDAFETLAGAHGLEAISGLLQHEVNMALAKANAGQGLPPEFRNRLTDYKIPFSSQQTLRMIFKITREMMTNNSGNFSRLLRNFIESPVLLYGLRTVIVNPDAFGSSVWSGAVNIMSSFIHNEPTSYTVVSEAGLSKGFLETISNEVEQESPKLVGINAPEQSEQPEQDDTQDDSSEDEPVSDPTEQSTEHLMSFLASKVKDEEVLGDTPLSQPKGILPAGDAIISIPHAIGALCLNHAGMAALKKTNALENFFRIFESPPHLKTMSIEQELAQVLGSSFDELVRHHPALRIPVLKSLLTMILRVKSLCLSKGMQSESGAKLWVQKSETGSRRASGGPTQNEVGQDIVMSDVDVENDAVRKVLSADEPLSPGAEVADQSSDVTILDYLNAVVKFLSGIVENHQMVDFLGKSGIVDQLLELATLPVMRYDCNNHAAFSELRKVLRALADKNPVTVLPAIVQRTKHVLDSLRPLLSHERDESFFADFTIPSSEHDLPSTLSSSDGTKFVQSLVHAHTLCSILSEILMPTATFSRSQPMPFSQVNLTDIYAQIIKDFGLLHRFCVWEGILLTRRMSSNVAKSMPIKGHSMGSTQADEALGVIPTYEDLPGLVSSHGSAETSPPRNLGSPDSSVQPKKQSSKSDRKSATYRNTRTLRFLFTQIPPSIISLMQNLGKTVSGKRRSHSSDGLYNRQSAMLISESISTGIFSIFTYSPPRQAVEAELHTYWMVILSSLSNLMIEGEGPHQHVLTLLLFAFNKDGGLDLVKDMLKAFSEQMSALAGHVGKPLSPDVATSLLSPIRGIEVILDFYKPILAGKPIVESAQSTWVLSDSRSNGEFWFNPKLLLIDIRATLLPVVKSLWEPSFVEKAPSSIIKRVVEIMRTILEASEEQGAPRSLPEPSKKGHKTYEVDSDKVKGLTTKGFEESMAREALYRCFNSLSSAETYCKRIKHVPGAHGLPIPEYELDHVRKDGEAASSTTHEREGPAQSTQQDTGVTPQMSLDRDTSEAAAGLALLSQGDRLQPAGASADTGGATDDSTFSADASTDLQSTDEDPTDPMAMSLDLENLQNANPDMQAQASEIIQHPGQSFTSASRSASRSISRSTQPTTQSTSLDELNTGRDEVRNGLIDRVLDILNDHDDVSFELSDLITAATSRAADVKEFRSDVGQTLVQSLISFSLDEKDPSIGKKVASYANLLALVLQNKDFFDACTTELKENFEYLTGFIKLTNNVQAGVQSSPWICQTLLVIEKLLSEDAQPPQIKFPSSAEGQITLNDVLEFDPPLVSREAKSDLFEALLKLMPSTGRDEAMVLSITRILVILTRDRGIASQLAEKKNIQRFFLMIKQLSGMVDDKLPGTIMIVVRHMFETEDIIRRIMRSEIRSNYLSRSSRSPDLSNYVKNLHHLAIRSPEIFSEATNESLELYPYDPSNPRHSMLRLRSEVEVEISEAMERQTTNHREDSEPKKSNATDQPTTENALSVDGEASTAASKTKAAEKVPTVDHPSGVIHYLLSELLSYKDTDDSISNGPRMIRPPITPRPSENDHSTGPSSPEPTNDTLPGIASPGPTDTKRTEFKPEQHPIHTYRCFILQCLTEILHSYNQAKVEFINFSRKVDGKASTPSKPRSSVLNYLLNDAIPVGVVGTEETVSYKKREISSNWAISVVVALCMRTPEDNSYVRGENYDEDQVELTFVRKFVLEHALKAYKDASASDEDLSPKYGRLLDLADLLNRLLTGQLLMRHLSPPPGPDTRPQKAIAKLMFEKGFIAALTNSISEINLGFKGADRAVRYILRPLKQLSSAAIELSELSDISTSPGPSDEEEEDDNISSATSTSEIGNGREDTPDLFRNSTLGMFEPDREGSSDSDSSRSEDEEMFEDEYDDGMDYDDPDPEDMISDEEEEMDGMGSIEGLSGNHHMDVIIDEEEDEDDDEDEDEDDEDENDEDEDEDNEMGDLEEVNADNENASLGDENGADWEDEDEMGEVHDDDFDEDEQIDINDVAREVIEEAGGPGAALQRLEGLDDNGHANLIMDVDTGQYMNDIVRPDVDDEDEDEDGEDMDDDEGTFDDDDDDSSPAGIPARIPDWGWDDEDDSFVLDHHHRHHHPSARRIRTHQIADPWTVFPNGPPRMTAPYHRAHRPGTTPRQIDDGVNPLLQRADRIPTSVPMMRDPMGLSDLFFPRQSSGPTPTLDSGHFIRHVLQSLGSHDSGVTAIPGPGGNLHIQITGRPGDDGSPLNLLRMSNFPPHRHLHDTGSSRSEIRSSLASFTPQGALQRWTEEAKILFAGDAQTRAARVVSSLLRLMVPHAEEKKKQREAEEKRLREEAERKEEQERKEREEREQKEKKEREKREAEEAAEAAAAAQARAEAEAEAAARSQQAPAMEEHAEGSNAEPMEGVEQADTHTDGGAVADAGQAGDTTPTASASQPVERQYVVFNNTQLDITDMGIDRTYLDALPEEIRNEVLMSQLAMQRAQTAAAGEPPTEIDNEFLEALPAEIRAELLQQEAQERRRRERQEAQRQQAATGGAPRAEEMDPASFFASLDPSIRQTVLMEQDEDILAQLPQQLAEEARALMGGRGGHRFGAAASLARTARREELLSRSLHTHHTKKPPRKPIVQILDKAGVATLLRLMFIQLSGQMQEPLQKIFEDAVQNRQNRAEIISMLLSLLNEGSVDAASMERSYALISARSKQPIVTKTPLKRTVTDTSVTSVSSLQDLKCTPLSVIHQCLAILVHLVSRNQHLPSFFLNEVDASSLSKGKSGKKGKAKETKASRYPINTLLGLLDRSLVTENVVCVERLADLLQRITYPLILHWKKENEAAKEEKRVASAATNDQTDQAAQSTTDGGGTADASAPVDTTAPPAQTLSAHMGDAQPTGSSQDATAEASGSSASEPKEKPEPIIEGQEKEATKKPRTNPPPVIPQENLALVINVIMARECPSNTFRATLSTMTNLSILPGAKEVFGQRLVACALELGELVLNDLNELIPQIKATASGGELQAAALTKFSPQSSDQAKLLRILKALDYLFDPKREDIKAKTDSEEKDDVESAQPSKADLVTTLYENATFSLLWKKLSECLRAINHASSMLNVATILLPLVEALMVVCTNTTTKDAPLGKFVKEFTVSSPAPESQMESLFFRFTEEHRKILNELVRHNPKLMSGTFQLLVKNPKVLDFDNKRNYFGRRLHQRDTQTRHPQPPLQLGVRREYVFLDSFKFLHFKSGDEIKYGKLNIRFSGEEGVDAGGVTREWFQVMSRQMFNPDYALFIPVASDRTTFHPNKLSKVNEEHLLFFKFIGRIIGKALYEGRALDCHFSRAVYKRILGKTVSIKDMETLDLEYYRNVLWMLGNDITEIITETMSVQTDDFGVTEIVDLVPNGRNIPVNEENKHEYVQLVVEHRLVGSVEEQLQKFLEGFHDIVPPALISIFNEQELELLISGLPDIDVDDWKSHTDYQNYSASSPQIQWFWRAVRSFDKEERAKLLQFVTGTSKVPLNGFDQLEGMNGFSRFNIHRDYGNKERLPSSHTCFNQLDLPEYEDYETLRKQLYTAMTAGSEYFGFA